MVFPPDLPEACRCLSGSLKPTAEWHNPDPASHVELPQQLADRRIEFGQTVEAAMAQAAEQPALDDRHRDFSLCLVARGRRGPAGRIDEKF
jgi:hypothetical protein